MKSRAFGLVCLLMLGGSVFAQSDRSVRPRVAATPTPAPTQAPTIKNDVPPAGTQRRPPVLSGGTQPGAGQPAEAAPAAGAGEEEDVIRVETNIVTMPVSVLDRDGRFISGLSARDFQIFEDGVQQKIEYFQSVEQPFSVILMLDVSPSTQYRIDEIQDAAIAFVDQLRPNDRVMVVAFDDRYQVLSPLTNDRRQLYFAIRRAQFGDGTSLYEAVDQVLNRELRRMEGRKAVVLFTDGVDTTSRRASYETTVADVEESDALFYAIRYNTQRDGFGGGGWGGGTRTRSGRIDIDDMIGIILGGGRFPLPGPGGGRGGTGTSRSEYETGERYLEELAQNSGGRKFEADSLMNIQSAFAGIAEELRRQYSLGYYPDNVGQIGDRKQIRVRVMRPNVIVKAKNTYIVGQSGK